MKTILIATMLLFGAADVSAAGVLQTRLDALRGEGWVAYEVPMVDDAGAPCCFDGHGKRGREGCDLDGRNWSYGTSDDDPRVERGATLAVYLHRSGGAIDRVRALASSCPARSATPIERIENVDAGDSANWLLGWIENRKSARHDLDPAYGALAYHVGAEATAALGKLAESAADRSGRESAVFWLGQTRGSEGAARVERIARGDADTEIREHAVFSLSQTKAVDGYAIIRDISQRDKAGDVRSKALFWMAQMGDRRAGADLREALRRETDSDVREQAVFAMSQLKSGGDAALIEVIRGSYPRDVKEKALFWLGQSGSDEAMKFLDDVLTKPANASR